MVIRIAVCGRLSAEAQKVERFVEDWALERNEPVQIRRFHTGEELLFETELSVHFPWYFWKWIFRELAGWRQPEG